MKTVRIALVGDYSEAVHAHPLIPEALALAAATLDVQVEPQWLATPLVAAQWAELLPSFDGIWCVPGSPYENMDGALAAITYAREQQIPFLGTCGGFQHAVIEYARNVLKLEQADHEESNSESSLLIVSRLSCSLVEAVDTITLLPQSRAAAIYNRDEITERYHCNYGVAPEYRTLLEEGGLHIGGVDKQDEVRIVELHTHPFFICTLFQPERSAANGVVHPLIRAYVQAAARL